MSDVDSRLIMQAALDGELDAAGQISFERRLADDPVLAKDYERLAALRRTLRKNFPREPAPAALRSRIAALNRPVAPIRADLTRRGAMRMAAALVIGIGIGGGSTYWAVSRQDTGVIDALIAGHRRALLSEATVDVASNDRHNVRPWFDAHIAVSPPAPDLAARGYPLVGGRIDVVAGKPAPTLVYRVREHVVSVTALPTSAAPAAPAPVDGFHALAWQGTGFTFWAVSDADLPSLESFADAFKSAETSGTESPR